MKSVSPRPSKRNRSLKPSPSDTGRASDLPKKPLESCSVELYMLMLELELQMDFCVSAKARYYYLPKIKGPLTRYSQWVPQLRPNVLWKQIRKTLLFKNTSSIQQSNYGDVTSVSYDSKPKGSTAVHWGVKHSLQAVSHPRWWVIQPTGLLPMAVSSKGVNLTNGQPPVAAAARAIVSVLPAPKVWMLLENLVLSIAADD